MKSEQFNKILAKDIDSILNAMHDNLLIADGHGVVMKTSPSFEKDYGIKAEYAMGKTVYQLEEEGYFKPSIIAKVLEAKKPLTLQQVNNKDRIIVVTATPVFNKDGNIKFVVSFSRDITDYINLQNNYTSLEEEVKRLKSQIQEDKVVGKSVVIKEIVKTIERISKYDSNVMILGDSGVGKTMFAKMIHEKSQRRDRPYIDINCAAIPESLLEAELFGYEKGSFTGADKGGKKGLIEMADGGTLLLDEIAETSARLQAKLLKVIQDKKITRVGGTKQKSIDFRLIVATNKNLRELVKENKFREDLFYRLNVIKINIPGLASRKEDILPLCEYFLKKFNDKYGCNKTLDKETLKYLVKYSWPGNIRELENIIEQTAVTEEGDVIGKENLPETILSNQGNNFEGNTLQEILEKTERKIILEKYDKLKTSSKVAIELGISQPTAYRKISKYTNLNK